MTLPPSNTSAPGDADQQPVGSTSVVRAESTPPAKSPAFTRSTDLADHLDAHETGHVDQMVSQGWEPNTAAEAWQDWVQVVAESAADGAVDEGSWGAS